MLFVYSLSIAQYVPTAPWMQQIQRTKKQKNTKEATSLQFSEIVDAFHRYWQGRDHEEKGSGYKPFMRWSEFYKNGVLPDGTLPSPSFLNNAWQQKQAMPTQRITTATQWEPMGPFDHAQAGSWNPGQGRVNVVLIDPTNSNTIYVGAPSGGIWKSTDRGATWKPLSDNLPQLGVSGIAVAHNDPNIIYISTGDDDGSDSFGIGVLKSVNGGQTWEETGLKFSDQFSAGNDIYIDPANADLLWVATRKGLYKTANAGKDWKRVLAGNIQDVKLKPGDATVLYAVSQNTFYKSEDGGDTFDPIVEGLPTQSGRLVIDVTPAAPENVYVLSAKTDFSFQGLYRSKDSGMSFAKTNEAMNIFESKQAWYDLAMAVSDQDPEMIFVGCINIWMSTDGGNDFRRINQWNAPRSATYTHADIHFLRYTNNRLLCGSDGGIYISDDNGSSFTDYSTGLQIGQFYKIAVAENQTSDHLTGGLQDNGGFGLQDTTWNAYHGGDGTNCIMVPNKPNTYYGFTQTGSHLYRTDDRGVTREADVFGPERGNWVTPLAVDDQGAIYAGYTSIYKLQDASFVKQTTFDFGGNIDCLEFDPINTAIVYAARGRNLYKSIDKGVNWELIAIQNTGIVSIEVHNDNSDMIYLATSGSVNGKVMQSTDGGQNFTDITGDLPTEGKFVIKHHKGTASIYLGTYLGVYHKNGEDAWANYSGNLPAVAVRDLEINLHDQLLLAGTYGRGIWKAPLEAEGAVDVPVLTAPIGLNAFNITANSVGLSWAAVLDQNVTAYGVYQDGIRIQTVTRSNTVVTNLQGGSSYNFTVRSLDDASNESLDSQVVVVTILADGNVVQSAVTTNEIPGTIQVEAYDNGGEGVAYHDADVANRDAVARVEEAVDLQETTDIGGGLNIGWVMDGEWLEYTIASITTGTYTVDIRVASALTGTKSVHLSLDGQQIAATAIPVTDGWQEWQTITMQNVVLEGGTNKVLRLGIVGGGFNINYLRFSTTTAANNYRFMAKGVSGQEQLMFTVGDQEIGTYTMSTSWQEYTATSDLEGVLRVHFINDSIGRDASIDYLAKNELVFQAETQLINTSVWQNDTCGGSNAPEMHCNGYIQFDTTTELPAPAIASVPDAKKIGMLKNVQKNVHMMPNPMYGSLQISMDQKPTTDVSIVIYDSIGRVVTQIKTMQQYQQINVSEYTSGLYFVKVTAIDMLVQQTILKK